jgi:hypothetical protein
LPYGKIKVQRGSATVQSSTAFGQFNAAPPQFKAALTLNLEL